MELKDFKLKSFTEFLNDKTNPVVYCLLSSTPAIFLAILLPLSFISMARWCNTSQGLSLKFTVSERQGVVMERCISQAMHQAFS